MEQDWLDNKNKLMTCLASEEAPCTSVCPFHLDIRSWAEKMKEGRFDSAYRLYANTVGFPAIVSQICSAPCRKTCLREGCGGSVDLRSLERTAVEYSSIKPNRYAMPVKKKRIAVIGGGLSGLGCALRLCNRKYQVSLFEKTERLGGHALALMDPEDAAREIERQFIFETCEWHLGCEVKDIDDIDGFDAVYIAAGADPSISVPKPCKNGKGPLATVKEGVFIGGGMCGADCIEALAQGLQAAVLIDGYLKSGIMRSVEPHQASRLRINTADVACKPYVQPLNGVFFDREEAVREADRCLRCKCDACLKGCGIMKMYSKSPFRIAEEVDGTLHPGSLAGEMTLAKRFLSSCNQCSYCADECPLKIDIGKFLLQSRILLHRKEKLPWAFFDYWQRDLEFSSDETCLLLPGASAGSGYLFFPGCQTGGSDPEYVYRAYEEIKTLIPDTGVFLGCCGALALWAGDEQMHHQMLERIRSIWRSQGNPTFILTCPTCEKMFSDFLPEIQTKSFFSLLDEYGFTPLRKGNGEYLQIFDPCAARENEELKSSVRNLLKRGDYRVREWDGPAVCCSFGGISMTANPKYADAIARERSKKNPLPYLTYCVNCRDTFASKGKDTWHMFDLLFAINSDKRPSPGPSDRRQARRAVYATLSGSTEMEVSAMLLDDEVREKIDKDYILLEDAERIIKKAESTGRKIYDQVKDHFIGHGTTGRTTLWVEYGYEGNVIRIYSAWAHRMQLQEQ